jgi:hypothetical protein
MNRRFWLYLVAFLVLLPLLGFAVLPFLEHRQPALAVDSSQWNVQGNFQNVALNPYQDPQRESLHWVCLPDTSASQGKAASPPFKASAFLSLLVAGYPNQEGNRLFVERVGALEQMEIKSLDMGTRWRRRIVRIPSDWQGNPIRLVGSSQTSDEKAWFGFSNPRGLTLGTVLQEQLPSLGNVALFLVFSLAFLTPGLAVALALARRRMIEPEIIVLSAICLSSLFGYAFFWVYFLLRPCASALSILVLGTAVLSLVLDVWKRSVARSILFSPDVILPIAWMVLVGAFYFSSTYSLDFGLGYEEQPRLRFLENALPGDNMIPLVIADQLYRGADLRQAPLAGWQSSDRPPLQAGTVLMLLPLGHWLGVPLGQFYQIVATGLQCAWIGAVFALLRLAKLTRRQLSLAMALVIFSGFNLINTVYVWPKMLSGALGVLAVGLLLIGKLQGRKLSSTEMIVVGLAIGLGALAHGGIGFTGLALGMFLLVPGFRPAFWPACWGTLALAAVMLPWLAYQSAFDPPGNRLVKLHLANDSARGGTWEALREAYAGISAPTLMHNKWSNLQALFVDNPAMICGTPANPETFPASLSGWLRRREFYTFVYAFGFLNLGWIAALWQWRSGTMGRLTGTVILFCVVNLLVWVVLMFGPGTTVLHHGNYTPVLLIFAILAAAIARLPRGFRYWVLALQLGYFLLVWIVFCPTNGFGFANVAMVYSSVACLILILVLAASSPVRGFATEA